MGLEDDAAGAKTEEARQRSETASVPPQPDAELLSAMEELRAGLRRRGVKPRPVYRLERVHWGYHTPGGYLFNEFVPPEAYAQAHLVLGHAWRFREANKPVRDGYPPNRDYYLVEEPLVLITCARWPMRQDAQASYRAVEGNIQ